MSSNRMKAQAYRQTTEGRLARQLYNQRPEVRMHNAVKRAVKKHQAPGKIVLSPMSAPHVPRPRHH